MENGSVPRHWERLFGLRVKDLRAERGWTQDDLAKRMTSAGHQMHQTTVAKMESGNRPTNIGEVGALAGIFGVPIERMFTDGTTDEEARVAASLARFFDRWELARREAIRARQVSDDTFRDLARFVQEHHNNALIPFYGLVESWAENDADTKTSTEAAALKAMVMARAIPVDSFKKWEDDAFKALMEERNSAAGNDDGVDPEAS